MKTDLITGVSSYQHLAKDIAINFDSNNITDFTLSFNVNNDNKIELKSLKEKEVLSSHTIDVNLTLPAAGVFGNFYGYNAGNTNPSFNVLIEHAVIWYE